VVSTDVVVVGGGVAGLAAADQLARAGKKILLLEARSRLGGRVHTILDPGSGHPVELGAEFLEGDPEDLRHLAHQAGLQFHQISERHEQTDEGRKHAVPDAEELIDRLLAGSASLSRDVPVVELLREQAHRFARYELDMMTRYLEGFHAADLKLYGSRALAENHQAEETDRNQMRRVVGGYGQLVRFLHRRLEAAGVEIRTQSPVTHLRWDPGTVELTVSSPSGGEPIRAAQAILAVPVAVLRAGQPEINPTPPGWEAALGALETGLAQRIDLRFERTWWLEPGRQPPVFVHGGNEPFPVWWTTSPPSVPFLTGWIGGPRAGSLANLGLKELVGQALGSLSSIFGYSSATLARWLRAAHAYDWSSDPYALGAYSYGGVGAAAAREILGQPVGGTLFLAGEALAAEGRNATVAGALSYGLRTAAALLDTVLTS
jgi:monoamine oxidase